MRKKRIWVALAACVSGLLCRPPIQVSAQDGELVLLLQKYDEYQKSFSMIETVEDIEENGYDIIEDQSFSVLLETFGQEEVTFIPIMERKYQRLAVLIADSEGKVLYKTDQLETNYKYLEQLEQPTTGIAAVSFQDLNDDGLTDIVLITTCENSTGDYAGMPYKVGDVLFQQEGTFYRDWRVSDKINRFSMNKSVEFIMAYVRDGVSTEVLYTAATLQELLDNGFEIDDEHCQTHSFEKQGKLRLVPGIFSIAEYDVFMIYLVNEQGYIVWSFQPMGEYENLYSLKGIACKDLDGDGMKDILVLARYSYEGPEGELLIEMKCSVYYQRTDGFEADTDFCGTCQEEDRVKLSAWIKVIREYWGWTKEE